MIDWLMGQTVTFTWLQVQSPQRISRVCNMQTNRIQLGPGIPHVQNWNPQEEHHEMGRTGKTDQNHMINTVAYLRGPLRLSTFGGEKNICTDF